MLRSLLILLPFLANASAAENIYFAREVLPILSENCFQCHGPESKSRRAGLRLDTKAGAFRTKKEITTIVPGKSAESEVIRRILSAEDDLMPPADSHRKLTAKQKEILRRWVDEGATWATHWAYEPLPKSVAVPKLAARSEIDAFVLARLKKEGFTPASEAPKATWLRRVTLDLTGLPPTIAELETFERDHGSDAYVKVVDRLLASSRYGERMASDWLDLARFADTLGYQHDRPQPMWPYRDWVIRAFNENKKFDRFLTEQLAGDLLPNATKDSRLATAFNRLHMQNEEGGIVAEEFRVAYVVDRVNTMGTAFLGQTFECCRCHDHKFDPLTQRDYYSLFAMFQNIAESGQTSFFTNAMNTPTLLLSTPEQDVKIKALRAAVEKAESALAKERLKAVDVHQVWQKNAGLELIIPDAVGVFDFNKIEKNQIANSANEKLPGKTHDNPKLAVGPLDAMAIALNGENGVAFPGVGHFTKSDPFTICLSVKLSEYQPRAVVLHHSRAPIDAGSRGYELLLENGCVSFGLNHMWPGNSIRVRTRMQLPRDEWIHIAVSYDGSSKAEGISIYLDGHSQEVDVIRDNLTKDITYSGGEPELTLGYRFRDNGFKGGAVTHLRIHARKLTNSEILDLSGFIFANPTEAKTKGYFFSAIHGPTRQRQQELNLARRELAKFVEPIPEIMVMDELHTTKPAFILNRGVYDSPGDKVTSDTPKALPPLSKDAPHNRLGLANWLTQPDHPLTARVTVNRLWQQMFGRGLVETSDNFGTTGTPPTHPELLDWLARDFVDHGWDVKRTLKLIALSNTYRQSSRTTSAVREKDPFNHLLSHASARRLTAEMLRDQALAASGLLAEKVGGPSVFPLQPAGLWNDAMGRPKYPQSKGDDLHRRSLYTHWKRTAPPPTMTTFDAADRQNCAVRRQSTNTPLQALVLLNDPQMTEAATALAERMRKEKTLPEQIRFGFRAVTSREPSEKEIAVLSELLDLSTVALTILNHDEAVNRR